MDRSELVEIRSEEVQDIISRSPSWILRWGILLIFFIFISLLFLSWFIRYPDIIKASVIVTTEPSPVFVVSRTPGKISLLKKENETLKKGDLIGYTQSNANPENILLLEKLLNQFYTDSDIKELQKNLIRVTNVGTIQSYLNNALKALQTLLTYEETGLYKKQITHLGKQVGFYNKLNRNLHSQFELLKQETILKRQLFFTDSLLFSQRVIAEINFNQSKTNFIQQQRNLKSLESSIISNELQIETLEKQVMELKIEDLKQKNELQANTYHTLSELVALVTSWKETYLFRAPVDGRLAYLGFLENNQYNEPKPLFALLPESNALIAKAELPLNGAGKVKIGQIVKIRLSNYPPAQFGMLRGIVENISSMPNNENYALLIRLPQGMKSSYNKNLEFQPQLKGEMEIITEDLRLLERFFYQLRSLIINR